MSNKPAAHYTPEVREYIQNNHKGCGPTEMAKRLNERFGTSYTFAQMKGYYSRNKLNSGLTGRFQKGRVAPNKGKKGISHPGMESTQFKKGHLPHNTLPIGAERFTKDGYIEVKIAMRPSGKKSHDNWIGKHRLIWEKANGAIPDGHIIIFKDGNKQNCELSNLMLVSLAENARLNQNKLRNNDPELAETSLLLARILCNSGKTARKKRKKRNESANTANG